MCVIPCSPSDNLLYSHSFSSIVKIKMTLERVRPMLIFVQFLQYSSISNDKNKILLDLFQFDFNLIKFVLISLLVKGHTKLDFNSIWLQKSFLNCLDLCRNFIKCNFKPLSVYYVLRTCAILKRNLFTFKHKHKSFVVVWHPFVFFLFMFSSKLLNANAQFRCRENDYQINGICLQSIWVDCFDGRIEFERENFIKCILAARIRAINSIQFSSISGDLTINLLDLSDWE